MGLLGGNSIQKRQQELAKTLDKCVKDVPELRDNDGYKYGVAIGVIKELMSNPAVKNFQKTANQEPMPNFPTLDYFIDDIKSRGKDTGNPNSWKYEEFQKWYGTAVGKFAWLMWVRETLVKNRKQMEKAGRTPQKVLATIIDLEGEPVEYVFQTCKRLGI